MKKRQKYNSVAMIGCKDFSAENLYSLLMTGAVSELILIEHECGTTLAELQRLIQLIPLGHETNIREGNIKDAAKSDIAIIATGVAQNEIASNFANLKKEVSFVIEIAGKLRENNFEGVILIVSSPVDVFAQAVFETSGFPAKRIIGSGKCVDQAILGDYFEDSPKIRVASTWCAAMVCGSPMIENCQPNCLGFQKMLEADIQKESDISDRLVPSPFAVGSCIPQICEAILRDERTILPVAAMATGQYGIEGVFLNQPCIIRRGGVEEVIKLGISDEETQDLIDASEILKRVNMVVLSGETYKSANAY